MSPLSNFERSEVSKTALKELNDFKSLAEQSNANANHEFKILLSTESLQIAIKSSVEKFLIDLVIMGTKGASGAKGFLFGSNTVRAVKATYHCPVLIIPFDYNYTEPLQIAFPTDFSRFYGEELWPLKELAEMCSSKIRIVHIAEEKGLSGVQVSNLEQLKACLEDFDFSLHCMPSYAKKTQEINDFINELGIDVLVLIKYKHSLIEGIIKEPVIKHIGFKPEVPVMVIPSGR